MVPRARIDRTAGQLSVSGGLPGGPSDGRQARSTLQRRLAAIGYMHKIANVPSPIGDERIKATLSRYPAQYRCGSGPQEAATSDIVLSMTGTLGGESLRQLRDRAILLIGFASAMRRSELVALTLPISSGRQTACLSTFGRPRRSGRPRPVCCGASWRYGMPGCGAKAWIEAAGIVSGPVFVRIWNKRAQRVTSQRLHGRAIAAIVKRAPLGLASTCRPLAHTACDQVSLPVQ